MPVKMIYDYIMFWLFDTRSFISLVTFCIFSIKRKLTVVYFWESCVANPEFIWANSRLQN